MKHATEPAIMALMAMLASSVSRPGAMELMAPNCTPMAPRLVKPHSAYVATILLRTCAASQEQHQRHTVPFRKHAATKQTVKTLTPLTLTSRATSKVNQIMRDQTSSCPFLSHKALLPEYKFPGIP